jgi:hypothetical protein
MSDKSTKDVVEAHLPEGERRLYRDDKVVDQLLRRALSEDERESREAMLELRKVFYERKHELETLQAEAEAAKAVDGGKAFWAGEQGRRLGRITNLCRKIVALFNDMDMSLHKRKPAERAPAAKPAPAVVASNTDVARDAQQRPSRQQRLPRTYQGL